MNQFLLLFVNCYSSKGYYMHVFIKSCWYLKKIYSIFFQKKIITRKLFTY